MSGPWGICEECNQENTGYEWCNACNAKHFQQNFKNWTSGNDDIDKCIQKTQLSANYSCEVLEWIPYNKFYDLKRIAEGGYSIVYRAKCIDGFICNWDNKNQNWKRYNENKFVALKRVEDSKSSTLNFINEVLLHTKLSAETIHIVMSYGITQDPSTENYMMVLEYARNGTLGNYVFTNKLNKLSLESKLYYLYNIADGLNTIHKNELIHRDLHAGNILIFGSTACISDMGLCKNYNELENVENTKYGVLSYVAPEILRGDFYTKASDIYSFGIIMYVVISGLPPYYNMSCDEFLVLNICEGLRPKFYIKIPQLILHLIKRCLDANPSIRPTANEVYESLIQWSLEFDNQIELQKQIEEIKMINNKPLTNKIHPEDFYKSRSLNFKNLPEPKNSDDYYELYDNISSKIYSEIKSDKTDYLECEIID